MSDIAETSSSAAIAYARKPVLGNLIMDETDSESCIRALPARRHQVVRGIRFAVSLAVSAALATFLTLEIRRAGVIDNVPALGALFAFAISLLVLLNLSLQFAASFATVSFSATHDRLRLTMSGGLRRRLEWSRSEIADVYMIRIPKTLGASESAAVQMRDETGRLVDLGHGTPEECTAFAKAIRRGLKMSCQD